MSDLIGIVNYGVAGNIASVKKTIDRAGGSSIIVDNPKIDDRIDEIERDFLFPSDCSNDFLRLVKFEKNIINDIIII